MQVEILLKDIAANRKLLWFSRSSHDGGVFDAFGGAQ